MYMQGCIHCLHLQQHSGMTWRGIQGVWLGVSVYREEHKMEYKRGMFGMNTSPQVVNPNVEAMLVGIGYVCMT